MVVCDTVHVNVTDSVREYWRQDWIVDSIWEVFRALRAKLIEKCAVPVTLSIPGRNFHTNKILKYSHFHEWKGRSQSWRPFPAFRKVLSLLPFAIKVRADQLLHQVRYDSFRHQPDGLGRRSAAQTSPLPPCLALRLPPQPRSLVLILKVERKGEAEGKINERKGSHKQRGTCLITTELAVRCCAFVLYIHEWRVTCHY